MSKCPLNMQQKTGSFGHTRWCAGPTCPPGQVPDRWRCESCTAAVGRGKMWGPLINPEAPADARAWIELKNEQVCQLIVARARDEGAGPALCAQMTQELDKAQERDALAWKLISKAFEAGFGAHRAMVDAAAAESAGEPLMRALGAVERGSQGQDLFRRCPHGPNAGRGLARDCDICRGDGIWEMTARDLARQDADAQLAADVLEFQTPSRGDYRVIVGESGEAVGQEYDGNRWVEVDDDAGETS